jgi:hypothetical protein
VSEWLAIARQGRVVRPALKVAAVVGTLLVLINQGDLVMLGSMAELSPAKILLTYCVPYCVSTWSAVTAIRANETR